MPLIDLIASRRSGDNWTQTFADLVDYVHANIHPFFAGEPAANAAAWTYSFDHKDTPLKALDNKSSRNSWPSPAARIAHGRYDVCSGWGV